MLNHSMIASRAILNDYNPFNDGTGKALWKMDGDVTDASVTYNGTAYNLTYDTGVFGQAAVFNGSSSFISATAFYSTTMSVSFRVKISTQKLQIFAGECDASGTNASIRYLFGLNANGTFRILVGNGTSTLVLASTTIASGMTTGVWYNLCFVINGTSFILYKDNVVMASLTMTGTMLTSTLGRWYMGSAYSSAYLNGSLDHFRIFGSALTAAQVLQLYQEEI